jgi:hypothetical protein
VAGTARVDVSLVEVQEARAVSAEFCVRGLPKRHRLAQAVVAPVIKELMPSTLSEGAERIASNGRLRVNLRTSETGTC